MAARGSRRRYLAERRGFLATLLISPAVLFIGLLVGAPLAGLAIDLAKPYLGATDGYQILWPICGLGILGAIPLLVRLMAVEDERVQAPIPAAPSPLP